MIVLFSTCFNLQFSKLPAYLASLAVHASISIHPHTDSSMCSRGGLLARGDPGWGISPVLCRLPPGPQHLLSLHHGGLPGCARLPPHCGVHCSSHGAQGKWPVLVTFYTVFHIHYLFIYLFICLFLFFITLLSIRLSLFLSLYLHAAFLFCTFCLSPLLHSSYYLLFIIIIIITYIP